MQANSAQAHPAEGTAMKSGGRGSKTDEIILALLEHGSIEKAAAALGISDTCVLDHAANAFELEDLEVRLQRFGTRAEENI